MKLIIKLTANYDLYNRYTFFTEDAIERGRAGTLDLTEREFNLLKATLLEGVKLWQDNEMTIEMEA